jgi:type IV secretion system protein TrbF
MADKSLKNPYLEARTEWNERYGDALAQAYSWRLACFAMAAVTLVSVSGAVWIAAEAKIVPYVVDRGPDGTINSVGYAVKAPSVGVEVERAYLRHWIEDVRTVTRDFVLEKKAVDRVYALMAEGSAAKTRADDYFNRAGNSPFDRAATVTVSVDVNDPLAVSDESWTVTWTETTRDRSGQVTGTVKWKATIQMVLKPDLEHTPDPLNPLGLYITDFDWGVEHT